MSIVEKMARAMAEAEGWRWDDGRQMLDCAAAGLQNTSRERGVWRNRAIAALNAMREPTEAMVAKAGSNIAVAFEMEYGCVWAPDILTRMARAAHLGMISAAIEEHQQ